MLLVRSLGLSLWCCCVWVCLLFVIWFSVGFGFVCFDFGVAVSCIAIGLDLDIVLCGCCW